MYFSCIIYKPYSASFWTSLRRNYSVCRCVFRESNAGEKFRAPYVAILLISLSLLF